MEGSTRDGQAATTRQSCLCELWRRLQLEICLAIQVCSRNITCGQRTSRPVWQWSSGKLTMSKSKKKKSIRWPGYLPLEVSRLLRCIVSAVEQVRGASSANLNQIMAWYGLRRFDNGWFYSGLIVVWWSMVVGIFPTCLDSKQHEWMNY